jgi:hypothetical protein
VGCDQKLKPSELKKYVENKENGFISVVDVAPYTISCMYMPAQYMAINHFKKDNIGREEFKAKENAYKEFDLYSIEVSSEDSRNLTGLQEYFSFYLQENILKVCQSDTFPCSVYHAEPFNSISGRQKIEIGFPEGACQNVQVILRQTPFSQDNIQFTFDKSRIIVPNIKLN